MAGLEIKLQVPSLYELPSRVLPQGAVLDGARRQLTWRVPGPGYGDVSALAAEGKASAGAGHAGTGIPPLKALISTAHTFCALFYVSAAPAAARAALRSAQAEVALFSAPHASLTGVTLEQHGYFTVLPPAVPEPHAAAPKAGDPKLGQEVSEASTGNAATAVRSSADEAILEQRAQAGAACTSWVATVLCRPRSMTGV